MIFEKWEPVFGQDGFRTRPCSSEQAIRLQFDPIELESDARLLTVGTQTMRHINVSCASGLTQTASARIFRNLISVQGPSGETEIQRRG